MRLFGLIGYPLSHSFSKGYFAQKFADEKIPDCHYENFPIADIKLFPETIDKNPDLVGLNVTIPYKEKVLSFLDEISEEAKEIGAVNTIRITRKNDKVFLSGHNTDVYGFMESLWPMLSPHHSAALVLGTGGASKAVRFVFKKLGIKYLSVSRSKGENTVTYEELSEEVIRGHKIIVNTTPLGTFPKVEELPPLPYQYLSSDHLLYDLVYNPAVTSFLSKGTEYGCITKNGLEMLHLQAEKAWKIWNE